jgi:hypothetical protein
MEGGQGTTTLAQSVRLTEIELLNGVWQPGPGPGNGKSVQTSLAISSYEHQYQYPLQSRRHSHSHLLSPAYGPLRLTHPTILVALRTARQSFPSNTPRPLPPCPPPLLLMRHASADKRHFSSKKIISISPGHFRLSLLHAVSGCSRQLLSNSPLSAWRPVTTSERISHWNFPVVTVCSRSRSISCPLDRPEQSRTSGLMRTARPSGSWAFPDRAVVQSLEFS